MNPPSAGSLRATSSASVRTAAQIGSTEATPARCAIRDFAAMVLSSGRARPSARLWPQAGNEAESSSQCVPWHPLVARALGCARTDLPRRARCLPEMHRHALGIPDRPKARCRCRFVLASAEAVFACLAACLAATFWLWIGDADRCRARRPADPRSSAMASRATPTFFPIGVWLQNPRNAAAFRAIGINTYVGLWNAPTNDDLAGAAAARPVRHRRADARGARACPTPT